MPSFVEFLKGAVVKAGASARLQCTVECQPKPAKITWCVSVSLSVRLSVSVCLYKLWAGFVFTTVCLSVVLFVIRITQTVTGGFYHEI